MEYLWFSLLAGLFLACMFLNVLGLPGNWVAAGLAALWAWLGLSGAVSWRTVLICLGLALAAEAGEWIAQSWGAKRYGASKKGNWGGIIGAFVGGIACAPFLLGFGALLGGLAGAFCGTLLVELCLSRKLGASLVAAKGSFFGKTLGTALKLAAGAAIVFLCLPQAWPI
jgi:uncharacterized protein YqgC (DUF456 family)